MAIIAEDAFNRISYSGWGTADIGGAWSPGTGMVDSSNKGTLTANTTVMLGPPALHVSATAVQTSTSSAYSYPELVIRNRDISKYVSHYYYVRYYKEYGVAQMHVGSHAGRLLTCVIPENYLGRVGMRLEATGSNPTVVRAKMWPGFNSEPSEWSFEGDDSVGPQTEGRAGVRSSVNSHYVRYFKAETLNPPLPLFLGTQRINNIYAGTTPIQTIHRGPTKIWP